MRRKLLILFTAAVCFLTGCANYVKDGTELMREGAYQEAIESFQESIDKEKDVEEAYRGMGMAYYKMQDYGQARENLQTAIDLGSRETPVVYNLIGICAMNLRDYDGALEAFEKGIALADDPDLDEASENADSDMVSEEEDVVREMKYNQIVCYEKKTDWAGAKAAADAYISAYPDDEEVQKEAEFLGTR